MSPRAIAMLLTLECPVLMWLCLKCFSDFQCSYIGYAWPAWPPPKTCTLLIWFRSSLTAHAKGCIAWTLYVKAPQIQLHPGLGHSEVVSCVCFIRCWWKKMCSNLGSFNAPMSRQRESNTHDIIYSIHLMLQKQSTTNHGVSLPRTWTTWMSLEDRLQCLMDLALASGFSNKFSWVFQNTTSV